MTGTRQKPPEQMNGQDHSSNIDDNKL
jgi:hypothetical protein